MFKKFIIAIAGFIVVVLTLGAVKVAQFKEMSSVSHVPPPSAVTTTEARNADWHNYVHAIGTLAPVEGVTVSAVVGDASAAADAQRFVAAAQTLAPLSIAVHNAGSNRPSPFLKLSEAEFEGHWREHALGGFQLAQAALLSNACAHSAPFRASTRENCVWPVA